jgi:hypothetical protein
MFEVLKERYSKNEDVIERIANALQTSKDIDNFGKLIADIYEMGFLRAVDSYKTELAKLGYNVTVTPTPPKPDETIQT